jgi:hypothetical protein
VVGVESAGTGAGTPAVNPAASFRGVGVVGVLDPHAVSSALVRTIAHKELAAVRVGIRGAVVGRYYQLQ